MGKSAPLIRITVYMGVLAAIAGCRQEPPPAPPPRMVNVARPVARDNRVELDTVKKPAPPASDPAESAVLALLKDADGDTLHVGAMPKGTRLLKFAVNGDSCTLDMSREFGEVNQMGDTGESLAQNALRRALAPFPKIKKLSVLVEGRPFEGEHSGAWTDIPVQDSQAQTGANP